MGRERADVVVPLAQRRQVDLDRVEPEEQVLAEAPGGDFGRDVGVGGRKDPHVDPPRARGADPLDLAALEHAEQLGLLARLQRADLVQQQRAAFGQLEASDAVRPGVGERALHVTEHLALEEPLGEPAQVDRHERARGPRASRVDPLRRRPPCRSRARRWMSTLASDGATRSISWSTGRMAADSAISGGRPSRRSSWFSPSSRRVAPERPAELDLGPKGGEEPGVVPRLLDEVARAPAHRLDGLVHAAPGGHHHRGQRGVEGLELGDQLQALAAGGGVAGVVEVEQDGVEVGSLHRGQHGGRRAGGLDGVAFALEQQAQRLADVGLVVRDEDAGGRRWSSTTSPGRWNRREI